MMEKQSVILENDIFRLVLTPDCVAESLILKSNSEECIYTEERLPFFSLTEERPYNNEVKLAYPNKRTTFEANRVRIEGDRLIVGFELIDFEAVITVKVAPRYIVFTLTDFIIKPDSFGLGVMPMLPPVSQFRLVQLPVCNREHFGEWLNVMWDERAAVNVLSVCPYPRIASEQRKDHRILFGETLREIKMKDAGVALIVSEQAQFLDTVKILEEDYDLPRGVDSRRSPLINRSYYWVHDLTPKTVDEHIKYALQGGFKLMSIYFSSILATETAFINCGEYDRYRKEFPNGKEDLVKMLDKIKAAGITPGVHILHSHIGLHSKYLTPVADHRVNLASRFTLSKPASASDTTLYVEECPEWAPVYEKSRVLRFMGELIQYESYSTERPYCFVGCKRGYNGTTPRELEIGTAGGVLDITEFGGTSAYIDQRTDLQDEIADSFAELYDAGFEFVYFDGSEGTHPPFDINVGLAQWRIYKKLKNKPIFCEGAAKSHFSWHMLSGGNAFDVFEPNCFKEMTVKHPFKEAPNMANDFTRVNFGWWAYRDGQRPDIFEFGTALGASFDCPGAFQASLSFARNHPRAADIFESFRRWELARATGFVTPEIKAELRKTDTEHTLLINEFGELELRAWEEVKDALGGDSRVTVFVLERDSKSYAVFWHNIGRGELKIPCKIGEVSCVEQLGGKRVPIKRDDSGLLIPVSGKRYLITDLSVEELKAVLANSYLIEQKPKE